MFSSKVSKTKLGLGEETVFELYIFYQGISINNNDTGTLFLYYTNYAIFDEDKRGILFLTLF